MVFPAQASPGCGMLSVWSADVAGVWLPAWSAPRSLVVPTMDTRNTMPGLAHHRKERYGTL